jgi:spermidine/putrescine transport system permease protein
MDVALSPNGRRIIRVFFALVLVFLYAPIAILLIFSFNKSSVPSFPLSGFTFQWYHDFATNGDMQAALKTSAIVAAISSVIAVALGVLASLALSRRDFRGKGLATAFLLTPLVIPFIVLGISLLLLYHQLGIPLSILTIVIGHVVISLPYTILVLLPRLSQIDRSLTEAAYDLGAGAFTTFRRVTLPLIVPAVVSAFLIAFTTSFDEYAIAQFLAGPRLTFPLYLFSQLRFPDKLPQVIAVAVVILTVTIAVVVGAELWRRRAEARLGEAPSY